MQSLRHASRGAMAATMCRVCVGSGRAYCGQTASRATSRKSREERHGLVMQFIEKYKAANNGQAPTISLVRKEVGGKYELLKEIFDNMVKGEDRAKVVAQSAEAGKVVEETKESTPVVKDSAKMLSTSSEKEAKQSKKVVKEVKSADEQKKDKSKESMDESSESKAPQLHSSNKREKAASKSATTDEGFENEAPQLQRNKERERAASRSAAMDGHMEAPEKLQSVTTQEDQRAAKMKDKAQEVDSKNDIKKHSINHTVKAKASSEVKAKDNIETVPDIANGVYQSMEEGTGKYFQPDFVSGHNKLPQQTSVVRIFNLPLGTKPEKIKALCRNVVNVHDVEMRRPRIADVHLNLKDSNQLYDIMPRLRKVVYGNMKVFPAQRFSCGGGNKQFKPQNAQQLKQVQESLFHQFEQRLLNLRCQVQDYHQLLAMKRDRV